MKYSEEDLKNAVAVSYSYSNVLRILGIKQAGGSHSHIAKRIKNLQLDTSHFTGRGHQKNKRAYNKKSFKDILVILPEGSLRPKVVQLRRALDECGVRVECIECGLTNQWNGKFIQLEVDHINNNWLDNRLANLQYLCPNCHTQKEMDL